GAPLRCARGGARLPDSEDARLVVVARPRPTGVPALSDAVSGSWLRLSRHVRSSAWSVPRPVRFVLVVGDRLHGRLPALRRQGRRRGHATGGTRAGGGRHRGGSIVVDAYAAHPLPRAEGQLLLRYAP